MKILEPRTSFQPSAILARAGSPDAPSTTPGSLAEAVRLAVRSVACNTLLPVAGTGAGLAYQPESLLAVVVYCYARGIYSSLEIEDSLWRDRQLREVAGHDVPCAKVLRRFRHHNREPLHRCLMALLDILAERIVPAATDDIGRQKTLSEEAHRRIAMAMFIDQMESEDAEF